jgi:glycosyltransferase involved in cell wall biosynthesis
MITAYPRAGELPTGGVEVSAYRLVRALSERGVQVTLIVPDSTLTEISIDNQGVIRIPVETRLSLVRSGKWRRRVVRLVNDIRPDIVHGQGIIGAGLAAADIRCLPRIVTAHGNTRADTLAAYGGLGGVARAALRDWLAGRVARRVEAVISGHPDWRVNLPEPPRRFLHIPNIVDDCFLHNPRAPNRKVVLFTGGPRAIKGWPVLAAAWPEIKRAVPGARLVATGWQNDQLPREIDSELRDSIQFEGMLASQELANLMAQASVLAIPSLYEVAPLVLAEAWALRLPVVASAVGGIPALADGAAILVPPHAPRLLAEGLIRGLLGGREIDKLAAEGRRRAEKHEHSAVAAAHVATYSDLAAYFQPCWS